jgi:hypothetical protein
MRKWAITGAVLPIILGVVAVGGVGRAADAAGTPGRSFHLYEHDTAQANIDLGKKGDSPGDRFIWSGDLFDKKGGKKLGRVGGNCETVSVTPRDETVCTGNFMFPGGQLLAQGLFDTSDLFGGKSVPWAVIGGTGSYRDARGTGTVVVPTNVPNQTDALFTFRVS